jgi:hypothetical protein
MAVNGARQAAFHVVTPVFVSFAASAPKLRRRPNLTWNTPDEVFGNDNSEKQAKSSHNDYVGFKQ